MRLTHIKLAGFKSFVDPTTLNVPGQLVAVIGPNGCGKSNVIDAVRWVLGEASAKQLRGESMQDVIFNGANTRKPAAKASVELVFDNSDGTLQGAWGQYQEVSIKRSLTRQGDSTYYINNQVVRRKDITDLFLGTGVGARGYAVIEQGMISKIIEAKPEELRSYLEEAAGVSKYKERRKETASRLKDTEEHLQRLQDIQSELDKQVNKLEKQASTANHYQSLRNELHEKQDWLDYLHLQDAKTTYTASTDQLAQEQLLLDQLQQANESVNEESYQLQLKEREQQEKILAHNQSISTLKQQQVRLEEQSSQKKWQKNRLEEEKQKLQTQILQLTESIQTAQDSEESWQLILEEKAMLLEELQLAMATLQDSTHELEDALMQLEQAFNHQQQEHSRLKREHALLSQNMQFTEQKIQTNQNQINALNTEKSQLDLPSEAAMDEKNLLAQTALLAVETLEAKMAETEEQQGQLQTALQHAQENSHGLIKTQVSLEAQLSSLKQQRQNIEAQQAKEQVAWLSDSPVLWESMQVDAPWQKVVSMVLSNRLFSRFYPQMDWQNHSGSLPTLIDNATTVAALPNSLASKVTLPKDSPFASAIALWLNPFLLCDDLASALTQRQQLTPEQCFVSQDAWLIDLVSVEALHEANAHDVLALQDQIDNLQEELMVLSPQLSQAETQVSQLTHEQNQVAQTLQTIRAEHKTQQGLAYQLQSEANALVMATKEKHKRFTHIDLQLTELAANTESLYQLQQEQQMRLETLSEGSVSLEDDFLALTERREAQQHAVKQHQLQLLEANRQVGLEQLEYQKSQQQWQQTQGQIQAWQEQIANHHEALGELAISTETLLAEDEALAALEMVNEQLQQSAALGSELSEVLLTLQQALQACQSQQQALAQKLPDCQQSIQAGLLKQQEAQLAMNRFQENLASRHVNFDLFKDNKAPAAPNQLLVDIATLTKQIQRLGPVNMAALDELVEAKTRQEYYQTQCSDIHKAIGLLNEAIAQIDLETKTLFLATFEEVNGKMQSFFPTLFGGGEAKLHLVGDDVLDAGVSIMARPPGKKNSTIYLLSGGEKALTAMSLVFALFSLNPAPFCLLDEVDAPLDDANTSRFCRLVEQMSDKTQFLYISHNRLTMEMAEQLIGVTMQEKGVSRIVDVDIKQAMSMAES